MERWTVYEASQGAEDKTWAAKAELWGNCYLESCAGESDYCSGSVQSSPEAGGRRQGPGVAVCRSDPAASQLGTAAIHATWVC